MMSAFESFLARLRLDPVAREAFRRDRRGEGAQAGLAAADLEALDAIDLGGLALVPQQGSPRHALAVAGASRKWWRHRQLVQRRRR